MSPGSAAAATSVGPHEAFLVVRVGDVACAWPVHCVREVRLPAPLEHDPVAASFADGVLRVRRLAVPVVDLRRRWGIPIGDRAVERVVLAAVDRFVVGFVVDAVLRVVRAQPSGLPADAVLPGGLDERAVRAVVPALGGDRAGAERALVIEAGDLLTTNERAMLRASRADSAGPGAGRAVP